jgi:hypothetical protein
MFVVISLTLPLCDWGAAVDARENDRYYVTTYDYLVMKQTNGR